MRTTFILLVFSLLTVFAAIPAQAQESVGIIQVNGTQLTQNGKPFLVKGLQLIAFVAPEGAHNRYGEAAEHFGPEELKLAQKWHANTIRFQIGEPEMDPESSFFSQRRVSQVEQGVKLARSMGLAVIVTIQDEKSTGEERQHQLPTAATARVLGTFTKLFNADRGIMYELYNEPSFRATSAYWELWKNGGPDPKGRGDVFVGMQQLIDQARASGSQNVLIVDALEGATNFQGVPALKDPLNQLVYAVHPFITWGNSDNIGSASDWDNRFGFLKQSGKALLVSEWAAKSGKQQRWCEGMTGQQMAQKAQDFLNYIRTKNIGVVGFAFDLPGTVVTDFNGTPSSYTGGGCDQPGSGHGEVLLRHFSN